MSDNINTNIENFGYKQELKRSLSIWDLIIYGLIFMVPIAPFGIYGLLASSSKGMVALVYAIGMVGMIFTAFSYARMSEAFPISGSVYAYASRGINSAVGFMAGWAILLDYILVPALLYVVSAAALHGMFPNIPAIIWGLMFIVINTVINIRGIEFTAGFNKIVLILELIVLVIFLVAATMAVAKGINNSHFTLKPFYDSTKFSLTVVMGAVSVAVLSFLGFDGISTLAEETKGGYKVVGKATVASLVIVGVFFILITYIAACLYPDYNSFKDINTAFYDIAKVAGGNWLMITCELATAFSWGIANSLAAQAAVARVLFSMARDKNMPSVLAKVHPKYKTPYVSTLFIGVVSAIMVAAFSSQIAALASLVNFGALASFLVLHITVVYYFIIKKKSKNIIKHLLFPIIGFIVILYVALNLDVNSKTLGLIWLCIGIVYYIISTYLLKRGPMNIEV